MQIAASLGAVLAAKGWTISCAESCTGGGVAYAITSTAGSSEWFERSFVTYSNTAKVSLLGVDENTLATAGAVSAQTVEEMVAGCARRSNAEVAVAVSGIAGPGGGSIDKPVGLVWFGFFIDGKVISKQVIFNGDRQQVRDQAIEFALSNTLKLVDPCSE